MDSRADRIRRGNFLCLNLAALSPARSRRRQDSNRNKNSGRGSHQGLSDVALRKARLEFRYSRAGSAVSSPEKSWRARRLSHAGADLSRCQAGRYTWLTLLSDCYINVTRSIKNAPSVAGE